MTEFSEGQLMPEQITPEQAENRKTDFAELFRSRLEAMSTIPEEDQERRAELYKNAGIERLKREAPALVFNPPSKDTLEIWTQDYDELNPHYMQLGQPHQEMAEWLADYIGVDEYELQTSAFKNAGFLLQDGTNALYLLVDDIRAMGINSFYLRDDAEAVKYLDMLRRYGITKVIGKFRTEEQKKAGMTANTGRIMKDVVDEDLIGQIREEAFYVNLARENGLSNSDFLRMRAVAKSAKEAGTSFDAIAYAKELGKGNRES